MKLANQLNDFSELAGYLDSNTYLLFTYEVPRIILFEERVGEERVFASKLEDGF